MTERNAEEDLINLIRNSSFKLEIEFVRNIVKKIWSSEVRIVKEYTDHGYEHSQRIIQKVYEFLLPFQNVLYDDELYLLLLSIYLHDIGMQCDIKKHKEIKKIATDNYDAIFTEEYSEGTANSYTINEQNEIRQNHHLLTGAWIQYSYNYDTILSDFVKRIDSIYLEDLIKICTFHSKLHITDCNEVSSVTSIRTKLIAAILRFGDELDIDKNRVYIETMKEFSYNTENAVFWYLHSRTTITVKNSAIKIAVLLNEGDYDQFAHCINKIYIQNFKLKNKELTDIISQNGIHIFISEDSKSVKHNFQKDLPKEIKDTLLDIYKKQISNECDERLTILERINLLENEFSEDNQDQILEVLLGKQDSINFMQKYKNEFLDKAQKLKLFTEKLKYTYNINETEVDKAISIMDSLRNKVEINTILDNKEVFENSYKIFLFVKAFTIEQLTYLSDIGASIPVQVYSGQALPFALNFFKYYFGNIDNPNTIKEDMQSGCFFNYYTFEQIRRILQSYIYIVNFNIDNIEFSSCYVYPSSVDGKLLAASVSGESNKILVWNIESNKHEPIAALGGLFEVVGNVKIYRYKDNTIITASGKRQIYFWDLSISSGDPTNILNSTQPITDFSIFQSINGGLYSIGLSEKKLYIWDLFNGESPISSLSVDNDIYFINTNLVDGVNTYECIGRGSFCDTEEPRIVEIIEKTPLNFDKVLRLEIYNHIDVNQRSRDGFYNRLNSYALDSKGKNMFLLINSDIYMADLNNGQVYELVKSEGQRVISIVSNSSTDQIYFLTYSIYQKYYENYLDLIHCYRIEEKNIMENRKWLLETIDVAHATFSLIKDGPIIFYDHLFSNKLRKLHFNSDVPSDFYTLPDTFEIKYITSE
jgi:hypothetical protein